MDRDQRWDRVEKAYNLLTEGDADHRAPSATEGLAAAYERDESDEFVAPTVITDAGGSAVSLLQLQRPRAASSLLQGRALWPRLEWPRLDWPRLKKEE